MKESRLASLIDSYIAGVLSAAEEDELRHWLTLSEDGRVQFERHISSYEITHPGSRLPNLAEFLDGSQAAPEAFAAAFTPGRISGRELFRTAFHTWQGWSALSACAAVLICAGVVLFRASPAPMVPFQPPSTDIAGSVAVVRMAANVKWLNVSNEIFSGDTLPTGRVQIAQGAVQLEFKRGARLVLEGPADLQLVSDNEAFLHAGKVTAHVPETAHGFRVTAPSVAVTDLGTEFGLLALSNKPAEVHVFSGVVAMARPSTDPRQLTQGQGARIESRRVRNINAKSKGFLFEDDLELRVQSEQHDRYARWREWARGLSQDPATLVHFTFEDHADSARQLANVGFAAPQRTDASITGCTWTSGRWPDKRALSFNLSDDRIRFSVPGTLTSLTYMAWLRIDNLVNLSNALAITESGQIGEVHWQVYRDGRVALSSHSGSGSTVDQSWDRGLSPPVFTPDRLGKWTHLVSVFDGDAKNIRHYVNGQFISSTPIKRSVPLKLGAVEIGNWGVRVDQQKWASLKNADPSYLKRHWTGCMDEFALLSRPLTEEEVRRCYDQGRVSLGTSVAKR
jgi:hypothetical protein